MGVGFNLKIKPEMFGVFIWKLPSIISSISSSSTRTVLYSSLYNKTEPEIEKSIVERNSRVSILGS